MSIIKPTIFVCDGCGVESKEPEYWTEVISQPLRYGTEKPSPPDGKADRHLCYDCSTLVHKMLMKLGIKHEYDAPLREREPFLFGRMFIP